MHGLCFAIVAGTSIDAFMIFYNLHLFFNSFYENARCLFQCFFFILSLRLREYSEDFVHVHGNSEKVPVEGAVACFAAVTPQSLGLQNGEHLMANALSLLRNAHFV